MLVHIIFSKANTLFLIVSHVSILLKVLEIHIILIINYYIIIFYPYYYYYNYFMMIILL